MGDWAFSPSQRTRSFGSSFSRRPLMLEECACDRGNELPFLVDVSALVLLFLDLCLFLPVGGA